MGNHIKKLSALLLNLFAVYFLFHSIDALADEAATAAADASARGKGIENPDPINTKIESTVDALNAAVETVHRMNGSPSPMTDFVTIQSSNKAYQAVYPTCISRQNTAAGLCLESLSPHVQEIIQGVTALGGAMKAATTNNACSTFSKGMTLAQAGLTAYTTACTAAKALCSTSCSSATKSLAAMHVAAEKLAAMIIVCPPTTATACAPFLTQITTQAKALASLVQSDQAEANPLAIGAKAKACNVNYTAYIASTGVNILTIVNALKQGQKCDEQTADPAAQVEKCKQDAYKQTTECLCLANPLMSGCPNARQTESKTNLTASTPNSTTNKNATGSDNLNVGGDSGATDPAHSASASGSGLPGAPTGGAGLGGGGGGGSGAGGGDPGAVKKLNTNILSGAGGGGGGGWGGKGSSTTDSKYKQYLPGGAKDPNQMGGQAWTKEVTSEAGKSNFEKVKDRYRDNKPSLLNN